MKPSAKVFGLALMAVLALSAVAASTASAAEETKPGLFTFGGLSKDTETAKIDVEQTAEGKDKFTFKNGLALTCKKVRATGEPIKTKASPEEDVANGSTPGTESTDVTLKPTYEGCKTTIAGLTRPVTVTVNECAFIFDAKTTTTVDNSIDHTALTTIECPTGKKIEIHIYEKEPHSTVVCTYDIGPQNTLSGITLDNKVNTPTSANDVLATINVPNIVVENTTPGTSVCTATNPTTATYTGEETIRATNEKGEFVDASVSD